MSSEQTPITRHLDIDVPDASLARALEVVVGRIHAVGGRALVVGGTVRDAVLGKPAKDLDIEVYGLAAEALVALLETEFRLDLVGRDFGVVKLRGLDIDVSLPRRESKRGLGHRGFAVHSDPAMGFAEAASRRDFTINALGWDPRSAEVLDAHGGLADLESQVLRHVSAKFVEDPLRVLRAMQLASRLDFAVAPATVALCRTIDAEGLALERIEDEWRKLILRGSKPSRGLAFLHDCGWLRMAPELEALVGCPQDPEWHPEGDVWVHTLHVMDAFASQRLSDEWEDLVVGYACLCHDLGKPAITAQGADGRVRSPDHEAEGEVPTRSFLARHTRQSRLADAVVPLVREHLKPIQLWKSGAGPSAIRRLARRVGRIDRLVRVAKADHRGRPPKPWDGFPAGAWLLAQAAALDLADRQPQPIVLGRHLIARGFDPGPHFGPILNACFEAQLDGGFSDLDGGLAHLDEILAESAAAEIDS